MGRLLQLLAVCAGSVVLCRGIALGVILLLAVLLKQRGRADRLDWFRTASDRQMYGALSALWLFSAGFATLAAWGVLVHWGFRHAAGLALILFVLRALGSWLRYKKHGISERLAELRRNTEQG